MLVAFDAAEAGLPRGPETQRKGRCSYRNTSISSSHAEHLTKNAFRGIIITVLVWLANFL